jgi:hypothetical protein
VIVSASSSPATSLMMVNDGNRALSKRGLKT